MYSKSKAIEYIINNGIDARTRKREIVDKRKYFFIYFKSVHQLTTVGIARIFKLNHSTVIHALKQYKYIKNDPQFLHNTEKERILFALNSSPDEDEVSNMELPQSLLILQNQFNNGKHVHTTEV